MWSHKGSSFEGRLCDFLNSFKPEPRLQKVCQLVTIISRDLDCKPQMRVRVIWADLFNAPQARIRLFRKGRIEIRLNIFSRSWEVHWYLDGYDQGGVSFKHFDLEIRRRCMYSTFRQWRRIITTLDQTVDINGRGVNCPENPKFPLLQ